MTPTEALRVALQKENTSIRPYQSLLTAHSSLKDLLTFLLNEEFKHKKLIEDEIAKVTKY